MTNPAATIAYLASATMLDGTLPDPNKVHDGQFPTHLLKNHPFVYITVCEDGLRWHPGTKEECACILTVMGEGKVVSRDELLRGLAECGVPVGLAEEETTYGTVQE